MSEKYFYHLNNLPELPQHFVEQALVEENYQITLTPNLYESKIFGWYQTDFLKSLVSHFNTKCTAAFILNPPNSYYKWHTDWGRHCALNWLIKTNPKAGAFYKEPIPEAMPTDRDPHYYNLIEVDYTLYKPTLLNTDLSHCVMNNYNDSRIIFTTNIFDVSYADVLDFLKNLNISSY